MIKILEDIYKEKFRVINRKTGQSWVMPVDLASLKNSVKCVLKWTLEKGNDFLYGGFISGQIGDKNQDKSVHRVVHLSLASMSNVSITIIDFSKQLGPTHDMPQHNLPVL